MRFTTTFVLPLLLVISAALVSGCATIIHGSDQSVTVTSSPSAADVEIKRLGGVTIFKGVTPLMVNLDREHDYNVVVKMEGYQESSVFINNEFDALFLGNILCGGIIGMGVDVLTGAMWKLDPDMIHVSLATASLMDGSTQMYAVFRTSDSDGNIRSVILPLIKES
jgi:hypothetical protein